MGVHEDREDFEKELKQQKSFQSNMGWCLSENKIMNELYIFDRNNKYYEQVEKWDSV